MVTEVQETLSEEQLRFMGVRTIKQIRFPDTWVKGLLELLRLLVSQPKVWVRSGSTSYRVLGWGSGGGTLVPILGPGVSTMTSFKDGSSS